jgi:hypothetical protein
MSWAERYRIHAAECLRLARQVTTPTDKTLLLAMADHWVRLAERAEARGDDDASEEGAKE